MMIFTETLPSTIHLNQICIQGLKAAWHRSAARFLLHGLKKNSSLVGVEVTVSLPPDPEETEQMKVEQYCQRNRELPPALPKPRSKDDSGKERRCW